MKYQNFGGNSTSAIIMGCMRLNQIEKNGAFSLIDSAIDSGINHFDHADIYGDGECESIFGEYLKNNPSSRDKLFIQSKCGIRQGYYDFSKEHILNSVDQSLKRLNIDSLDCLLLHRPDALFEPEEIADAFELLQISGKVKAFGVSNMNSMQLELLRKYVKAPIIANQLQFGPMFTGMIDFALNENMTKPESADRDGMILDYCRLNGITIQAWSPFQYGFFEGAFVDNEKFPQLNRCLQRIADSYGVTKNAIVSAWVLRHPANMQLIAGTTNRLRLNEICQGADITLSRQQWYEIYKATGKTLP
ncbi:MULTISPECIES: aldo/keto reductase family oxidoreductase [unclassified Ruminococcus]|uniref:aldo/keto reductase n=1 Tax=unclassified Ruminococcus TaxID=2608920 RepID=UPI002108A8F7|nr:MULTISPECIES: aldo/keto reductase [unclassified Ruminococcus]MCQ4022574.1 aldo/keto reductase family oxidoreductase [Ruminococcus sp. zg-924]MCQ4114814.1 aldo/keto reductase family oxidoreductase [Ruminococcus sp. zg-921]